MSRGNELYQQATEQVPVKWYESGLSNVPFWVSLFISGIVVDLSTHEGRLHWASVSALCMILGKLVDQYTTQNLTKQANHLKSEYDLDVPIHESASLIPDKPVVEDLYQSRVLLHDSALLALGIVVPQIGISLAVLKSVDALSNSQKGVRLQYLLSQIEATQNE